VNKEVIAKLGLRLGREGEHGRPGASSPSTSSAVSGHRPTGGSAFTPSKPPNFLPPSNVPHGTSALFSLIKVMLHGNNFSIDNFQHPCLRFGPQIKTAARPPLI
jgi:hypothetical protein